LLSQTFTYPTLQKENAAQEMDLISTNNLSANEGKASSGSGSTGDENVNNKKEEENVFQSVELEMIIWMTIMTLTMILKEATHMIQAQKPAPLPIYNEFPSTFKLKSILVFHQNQHQSLSQTNL
jgi:hypothetical protein